MRSAGRLYRTLESGRVAHAPRTACRRAGQRSRLAGRSSGPRRMPSQRPCLPAPLPRTAQSRRRCGPCRGPAAPRLPLGCLRRPAGSLPSRCARSVRGCSYPRASRERQQRDRSGRTGCRPGSLPERRSLPRAERWSAGTSGHTVPTGAGSAGSCPALPGRRALRFPTPCRPDPAVPSQRVPCARRRSRQVLLPHPVLDPVAPPSRRRT